jgi:hypothetical protein
MMGAGSEQAAISFFRRRICAILCALAAIPPLLVATPAECRKGVHEVHLTLGDQAAHTPNGAEEMGIYEVRRETGEFSKADSVRWLSAMKPDTEVAWTEPTTRAVDFTLTGRSTSDTVSVWITWTHGMVRQNMSLVADHRGRYRCRWNLDNDAGARVEPGVYCVRFERKEFNATLFYVVIRCCRV